MSVLNEAYKVPYVGRADTGPYPITFEVTLDDGGDAEDIVVKLIDPAGAETDITSTSTITGLNVYTALVYGPTYSVVLIRYPALTQPYTFPYGTKFPSRTFERSLDRLTFAIQRLGLQSDQSLKVPLSEASPNRLPSIANRALNFLAFDAAGNPVSAAGASGIPIAAWLAPLLVGALNGLDLLSSLFGVLVSSQAVGLMEDDTPALARARLLARGIADYASVSSTPYAMPTNGLTAIFLVTTGAPKLVFNVAAAASLIGQGPFTIIKIDSGAGAVQIAPNGSDAFSGGIGNVSLYFRARGQFCVFMAKDSGLLEVLGGNYEPAHGVDTNGTHYNLGKLHLLPLGNVTQRMLRSGAPPALSNWSSEVTGTGVLGIPAGAKALLVRVNNALYATAAGVTSLTIAFSDNNSNTPAVDTAHPVVITWDVAAAAGNFTDYTEIIIPLNSSGQFYLYTLGATNVTIASCGVDVFARGYYMGD